MKKLEKKILKMDMYDKNNGYALELEVSSEFIDEYIDYEIERYSESNNIKEITQLHKASSDVQEDVHETVDSYYRDKMPIGSDGYLSGGVHLHIFNKRIFDILNNFSIEQLKSLWYKMANCPLYTKAQGQKIYQRKVDRWARKVDENSDIYGTKSYFICLNRRFLTTNRDGCSDDGLKSFEFRLNNNTNPKIYSYYIACVLAVHFDIKLKKASKRLKDYLAIGDNSNYNNRNKIDSFIEDVELSHYCQEEEVDIITQNISILHNILTVNCGKKIVKDFEEVSQQWYNEFKS